MKYKSGNIYFTPVGAFMFIGPEDNIKLVTLFRKEDSGLHPVSNVSHHENKAWVESSSRGEQVINITDLIKEKFYEV